MSNVVTSITEVWSAIFDWMITAISELMPVFYVPETGLTLLGVLAIIALGVSIFFLILGLIQNFLTLRA